MDEWKALLESAEADITEATALLNLADSEGRALTDDEVSKVEALNDSAKDKETRAAALRENGERRAALEARRTALNSVDPADSLPKPQRTADLNRRESSYIPATARHAGRLKAFTGPDAEERAYQSGVWIASMLPGARYDWARKRAKEVLPQEWRAMKEGLPAAGGVLVPTPLRRTIIENREQFGVARQILDFYPMSSDTENIPAVGSGTTVYCVDEGGTITASDMTTKKVSITAKKWAALTKISRELQEDAIIDIGDRVAMDIARSLAEKEDTILIDGDGTSTYGGVVGLRPKIIDGTHTVSAVDVVTATHNLLSEVDSDDVARLVGTLPEYAHANAVWLTSGMGFALIFQPLILAAGGATTGDMERGARMRYLDFPIFKSPKMPKGAATDYDAVCMLFLGDFNRAIAAGERRGLTVEFLTELYAATDEVGVKVTERFGMSVHDLGDTTDAGPVVGLIGSSS